jgi:hypothetical protein
MKTTLSCALAASLLASVGLLALGARADAAAAVLLSRTYVSAATGNDANNCDRPTPCRTFQGAHDKTNQDGEITVLDTGGYGAVTIAKSISIINDGVGEASVLVSGGATGVVVNAGPAAYVNLRGITVQGIGFGGGTGVRFASGFSLTMTNCVVRNHTGDGIAFLPAVQSNLALSNTLVADNGGSGIDIQPAAFGLNVNVVLNRVESYRNSVFGVIANGVSSTGTINVSVQDSAAANNGNAGFVARSEFTPLFRATTNMVVVHSLASNNGGAGFLSDTLNASISVGQSTVAGNIGGAASGAVLSFGDNYSTVNFAGDAFPLPVSKK